MFWKKKSTFKGQKHDFNSLPPLQRNLRFALPAICDFISSSWKWTFIWRNIFCVFHSCYLFLPTAAIFYANRGDEVTHTSEPMTAGMWGGSSPSSSSFFSSSSMFSSSSPPPVVGGNYSPHQHHSHRAMWSSCRMLVDPERTIVKCLLLSQFLSRVIQIMAFSLLPISKNINLCQ